MKLKQIFLSILITLSLVAPVTVFAGMAAADCGSANTPKGQVLQGIGATGNDCNDAPVNNIFQTAVQILSTLVGVTSTIVIIYAGFRYITSGGESGRVSNAKATLMYALIGLAVAALAQLMIHFVLYQTDNVNTVPPLPTCPADKSVQPPKCQDVKPGA